MTKRSIIQFRTRKPNSLVIGCGVEVDTDWLQHQLKNRLGKAEGERVRLVLGPTDLSSWLSRLGRLLSPTIDVPDRLNETINFEMSLLKIIRTPDEHHFSVSVTGNVRRTFSDPSFDHYLCEIVSGSVRLRLRDGFTDDFFVTRGVVSFANWRDRLWREQGIAVAGMAFGQGAVELELLERSSGVPNRRSVRLTRENASEQLWNLTDCGGDEFLGPETILQSLRRRAESLLQASNASIRLTSNSGGQNQAAGVFYHRKVLGVSTLVRPNFAIEFAGRSDARIWTPKTLKQEDGALHFLGSDEVTRAVSESSEPQSQPERFSIRWKRDSANRNRWGLDEIRYPTMTCTGVSEGKLSDDSLWVYGKLESNAPVLKTNMSFWTRLHLPDVTAARRSDDEIERPGFPVPVDLQSDHWDFELGADEKLDEAQLALSVSPARMQLTFSGSNVRATSPTLSSYPNRLPAPSSPPNAKLFDTQHVFFGDDTSRIRLRPRRLLFDSSAVSDHLLTGLDLPKGGNFQMQCSERRVWTYVPLLRDAGIDFLSSGSKNLQQSVDPRTLRPIVERDTTHTLTPIAIRKLTIGRQGALLGIETFSEEDQHVAAAMALAPWIAMSDSIDDSTLEPKQRVLHHRNLVLEHGEFAVASQDRSQNGEPAAIAENLNNFLGAVRDAFSQATNELPTEVNKATEIVNWVPGARCDGPKVYVHYPKASDELLERAPELRLAGGGQVLRIGGPDADEEKDWLTFDTRLRSVQNAKTSKGEKKPLLPEIEVTPAAGSGQPRRNGAMIARNGSLPLLFDGNDFRVCSSDSFAGGARRTLSWFVAVDSLGDVSMFDRVTQSPLATLRPRDFGLDLEGAAPVAVGNGELDDGLHWILGIYSNGTALLWRRSVADLNWEIADLDLPESTISQAWVSAAEPNVALLLRPRAVGEVKLLRLNLRHASVAESELPDDFGDAQVMDAILYEGGLVLARGADDVRVWKGTLNDVSGWDFVPLNIDNEIAGLSPSKITMQLVGDSIHLGMLFKGTKRWILCQIDSNDAVIKIDQVSFTELTATPTGITLVPRPTGNHGLPPGCRPVWICVHQDFGEIDLWLSFGGTKLGSIDPLASVEFIGMLRPPYYRLRGQFDFLDSATTCTVVQQHDEGTGTLTHSSGLLTVCADGHARVWNLDQGTEFVRARNHSWSFDNLGTLRHRYSQAGDDFDVTLISCPTSTNAPRGSENSLHPAFGDLISISRAKEPTDVKGALVSHGISISGEVVDNATSIHFFCDGLRLRRDGDQWVPEKLSRSMAPAQLGGWPVSRGHVGVFGFHSTVIDAFAGDSAVGNDGMARKSTAFMPRVAGVPVFVDQIISMKLSELDRKHPLRIQSIRLRAAIINPIALDAEPSQSRDAARGQLPAPIAEAIAGGSVVVIELGRDVNGVMQVVTVENEQPITWTTVADRPLNGQIPNAGIGFSADLQQVTFDVSFENSKHLLVLQVDPLACSVRIMGGEHPLLSSAGGGSDPATRLLRSIALTGTGRRHAKTLYSFETASTEVQMRSGVDRRAGLPMVIGDPIYQFGLKDHVAQRITIHRDPRSSKLLSASDTELVLWDYRAGLPLGRFSVDSTVRRIGLAAVASAGDDPPVIRDLACLALEGATATEPDGALVVMDLDTSETLASIPKFGVVSECLFAAVGDESELIASRDTEIHRWDTQNWQSLSVTDVGEKISTLVATTKIACVALDGRGTAFAWNLGTDPTDTASRTLLDVGHPVNLLLVDADEVDETAYWALLSGGDDDSRKHSLIRFVPGEDPAGFTVTLQDLPDSAIPESLVWIDQRLHLIARASDDVNLIKVWLLKTPTQPSCVARWNLLLSESPGQVISIPNATGQILVAQEDFLTVHGVDGYFRFSENGDLRSQMPINMMTTLNANDVGFSLGGHLTLAGPLELSKHDPGQPAETTRVRAATTNQGLYGAIFDLHGTSGESGLGVLNLWREPDGGFGGSVIRSGIVRAELDVFAPDAKGNPIALPSVAQFTTLQTRTFGNQQTRSERMLCGSIQIRQTSDADDFARLFLVDQVLTADTVSVSSSPDKQETFLLTGYLDCQLGNAVIQGPVALKCLLRLKDPMESMQLSIDSGVYRAVSVSNPVGDAVGVDAMIDSPPKSPGSGVGRLVGVDLRVPRSNDVPAKTLKPVGTNQGLAFGVIDPRRVPVDLCLDSEVISQQRVAGSTVPQLGHLLALGTRLRFPRRTNQMLDTEAAGNLLASESGHWLLQPVVNDGQRIQILDVGVTASERPMTEKENTAQTENILAAVRPSEQGSPSLICLAKRSAIIGHGELLPEADFQEILANRMILIRMKRDRGDVPSFSVLRGNHTDASALGSATGGVISGSVPEFANTTRLLTHYEALNWVRSNEIEYKMLPDVSDSKRDNSRVACREFVAGQERHERRVLVGRISDDFTSHKMIVQEATAFVDMPRLWHNPPIEDLRPLIRISKPDTDLPSAVHSADGASLSGKGASGAMVVLLNSDGSARVDSLGNPLAATINADGVFSFNSISPAISVDQPIAVIITDTEGKRTSISLPSPTEGLRTSRSFRPAEMRLGLAPDKPGAMMHHRLHMLTTNVNQENGPIRLGAHLDFAVREPMQLNPPIGASIELLRDRTVVHSASDDFVNVKFAWKETLGKVDATARGSILIEQLPSQRENGVPVEDVQLRFATGSDQFLQMIVQINDQVREIDETQPFFPMYDARQVARTHGYIVEQSILVSVDHAVTDPVTSLHLVVGRRDVAAVRIGDSATHVFNIQNALNGNSVDPIEVGHEVAFPIAPLTWIGQANLLGVHRTTDGMGNSVSVLKRWGVLQQPDAGVAIDINLDADDTKSIKALATCEIRRSDGKSRECIAAIVGSQVIQLAVRRDDESLSHCQLQLPSGFDSATINHIQVTHDDEVLGQIIVAAWHQDAELADHVFSWRVNLDDRNELPSTSIQGTSILIGGGRNLAFGVANRRTQLFVQSLMGTVQQFDPMGQLIHKEKLPSPATNLSFRSDAGRSYLTASCKEQVFTWEVPQWRLIRTLTVPSGGNDSMAASIFSWGSRLVHISEMPTRKIVVHDLFLSQQQPPNVFLVTSLADFEPHLVQNIGVEVIEVDPGTGVETKIRVPYESQMSPRLIVETRSINGETQQNVNATFTLVDSDADSGLSLWKLSAGDPSGSDSGLDWQMATSVRISWVGELKQTGVPDDEDDLPRVEVVYGGENGKKKVQLIPYDLTAAKCAAVLVADQVDEIAGTIEQKMSRTLLFGDAAAASDGKGRFTSGMGRVQFAVETESEESVDTSVPVFNHQKLGLILVKYFAEGQTLSDAMRIEVRSSRD